jgi:hypothetical protein
MKKVFWKSAGKFYKNLAHCFFGSLVPRTTTTTYFLPQKQYKQVLDVRRVWLGVTLEENVYTLANTPEREEMLLALREKGEITEEEYQKCLLPLR